MKKVIAVAVFALAVLTSCTISVKKTDSPVDPNVFHLSSLPDIGSFSGNDGAGSFHEEKVYEFVPSSEYDEIIPYVGAYREFETDYEDWNTTQGYTSYGFCTPDGKIVMDASDINNYISYNQTDDGFVFYMLSREMEPVADAPDEYTPGELVLIPKSGEWSLTFEGTSWVSYAGEGYIFVGVYPQSNIDDVKTYIYDYDGKLVKILDGIEASGRYSHGLFPTFVFDSGTYTSQNSFCDIDGNTVLGLYSNASFFNENGIAPVTDSDGNAKLIDVNGNVVKHIEGYESIMYEFSPDGERQLFVARSYDEQKNDLTVFDSNGELIGTIDGTSYASLRFPDDGDIIYYFTTEYTGSTYTQKMVFRRLSDGSDVKSLEFGVSPNSYNGHDNCYVYLDEEVNAGILFDAKGETVAFIDDICEVLDITSDNKYIAYHSGKYNYSYDDQTGTSNITDTRKFHIYNTETKEIVYTIDDCVSAYFPTSASNVTDERFLPIYIYEESDDPLGPAAKITLYDVENEKPLIKDCKQVSFYMIDGKTYINVCTENSATLYDEDMKIIRKAYFE